MITTQNIRTTYEDSISLSEQANFHYTVDHPSGNTTFWNNTVKWENLTQEQVQSMYNYFKQMLSVVSTVHEGKKPRMKRTSPVINAPVLELATEAVGEEHTNGHA